MAKSRNVKPNYHAYGKWGYGGYIPTGKEDKKVGILRRIMTFIKFK
jgi:hypothetical protein